MPEKKSIKWGLKNNLKKNSKINKKKLHLNRFKG